MWNCKVDKFLRKKCIYIMKSLEIEFVSLHYQPKNKRMKKSLLTIASLCISLGSFMTANAQRYVTEIFPSFTKTSNVIYGRNVSVLGGVAHLDTLKMDIYQPSGPNPDPVSARPLVLVFHTGSFLPPIYNGQPTGSKSDSTIAETCRQFARRGYVAAAVNYRLGWNPQASGPAGQDIRTGTLLTAVYRSIQDAKACIRYFRHDVAVNGNTFGIDSGKIILGGYGSGGYVAMAVATLNNPAEIALPKFLAQATDTTYGFVAGFPYVNQAAVGGFEGEGGLSPYNDTIMNNLGYNSHVQFIFNAGGALGDSSWMAAGDPPTVCFHVPGDPFAPYNVGVVIVPTTGDLVVDNVSGGQNIIERTNFYGNNSCFANAGFTDVYTTRANAVNNGQEGLFPFYTVPATQAGPWEWYDSTGTVLTAQFLGLPAAYGTAAYSSALQTNPDMSKAKALAYIDTVMNYLNPRIDFCLGLRTGIDENNATSNSINIQPNPANESSEISTTKSSNLIQTVKIYDILGKEVYTTEGLNNSKFIINRNGLKSGVYLVKVGFKQGEVTQKLIFK